MNLFAAIFFCISLYQHWNLSAFLINVTWILISLFALFKNRRITSPELVKD